MCNTVSYRPSCLKIVVQDTPIVKQSSAEISFENAVQCTSKGCVLGTSSQQSAQAGQKLAQMGFGYGERGSNQVANALIGFADCNLSQHTQPAAHPVDNLRPFKPLVRLPYFCSSLFSSSPHQTPPCGGYHCPESSLDSKTAKWKALLNLMFSFWKGFLRVQPMVNHDSAGGVWSHPRVPKPKRGKSAGPRATAVDQSPVTVT